VTLIDGCSLTEWLGAAKPELPMLKLPGLT
jgi:hypothetical protein